MKKKVALGLDYGTLSVRGLLVDTETGNELSAAEFVYPHGVLVKALPNGSSLPEGYALAMPQDYIDGMKAVIQQTLNGMDPDCIVGIGLDCTSSTVLPVDEAGTPLCQLPQWVDHPQAYPKLWKHHGAEEQARRMQRCAEERAEDWLTFYGSGVQCELMLPKALETAEMDPAVWNACAHYLEMGDWLTWRLTGSWNRSLSMASSNGYYQQKIGYPNGNFWRAIAPQLPPVTEKLTANLIPLGKKLGNLTTEAARFFGLKEGIPVAGAMIDSHASALGCGANRSGDLVAVLGTSACYLMNSKQPYRIPGIYSLAYEAHAPGLYGYEGGQSCVGDGLDWFVKQCVTASIQREADDLGITVHQLLSEKAAASAPGASGLIALDWLNGVRSPLMRPDLKGVLVGATLQTTTAELYRAMIEACCYGARRVVDCYRDAGMPVERFFSTGGIPRKNPLLMQILADVCNIDITICATAQTSALGSAILGAAASGACGTLTECIQNMASPSEKCYHPQNAGSYEALYRRYRALASVFEQGIK
ncbi:MAG: ribulokinase [Eubacteriales bacterium]|nr:ribulokinase [Eubacteriales bacterium]